MSVVATDAEMWVLHGPVVGPCGVESGAVGGHVDRDVDEAVARSGAVEK